MASGEDWGAELKNALEALADVLEGIEGLPADCAGARVLQIRNHVDTAAQCVEDAWARYVENPAKKLLKGLRVSREEFYLLVAAGMLEGTAKQFSGAAYDDYELFDLMCYDDGKRRCYINPDLRGAREGGTRLRVGSAPEELDWNGLRPEQREFFSAYDPQLAERFRRSQ